VRNQISPADCSGEGAMVLVPGTGNQCVSTTSSRSGEYHCRFPLRAYSRQDGLDARTKHFSLLKQMLGSSIQVDLFATRQLPRFYSWRPDPEAEATDGFTQDWSRYMGFAPPPKSAGQAEGREGNDCADHPSVGNARMVPYTDGDVSGYSYLTT